MFQCLIVVAAAVLVWLNTSDGNSACWGFVMPPCLAKRADWANTVCWTTIAITGAGVLGLALVSLIDRSTNWMGGSAFPHLGTGLALAAAALLLHLAASGTVLLFDVVAHYLSSMNPWHYGGERAITLVR